MNLNNIWINLFGTTQWLGVNMGFWTAMSVCVLIVIIMNMAFWGMRPKRKFLETLIDKQDKKH